MDKTLNKNLKKKLLVIFIFILALGTYAIFYAKSYFFYENKISQVQTNDISTSQFVDFLVQQAQKFEDYDGQVIKSENILEIDKTFNRSSDLKMKNQLIIHFWASWCDPCINEIPDLLKFLDSNKDKLQQGHLQIVLVSFDYDKKALDKFLKSFPNLKNSSYIQIWDKANLLQKKYSLDKLPSTIVISNQNPVQKFETVVDWKNFRAE